MGNEKHGKAIQAHHEKRVEDAVDIKGTAKDKFLAVIKALEQGYNEAPDVATKDALVKETVARAEEIYRGIFG